MKMINQYFLEVFEKAQRQGPGSNAETNKAYKTLTDLPQAPAILDIGCGKGMQTLELARISDGHIMAIDMHKPFLHDLQKEVRKQGLQNKISCLIGDMAELPFMEQQFDLIWAEGSAFIIGYQQALKEWKTYLKRSGYLAFSDSVWLQGNPPEGLVNYWKSIGYTLPHKSDIIKTAQTEGFDLISNFTVAHTSWKDEFYDHIEKELKLIKDKYRGNVEAQDTFFEIEQEIEIYNEFNDYFGYEFYVLQYTNS